MTRAHEPIIISGVGTVSPIGVGARSFCAALRRGESGVRLLPEGMEGAERIRSTVAATCPGFDPASSMDAPDLKRLPCLVPMALSACREALRGASLDTSAADADDIGLILGTGAGGIDFTLDQAQRAYEPRDAESALRGLSLWTITNATHGNLAGELSINLGLRGPSLCVSTGCASSSDAIGQAMESLRSDRPGAPRAMLVVGADAHVRWETLAGMELLKVISTTDFRSNGRLPSSASRPFDVRRDGFVLGEGAWAIVLERRDFAHQRGAPELARLLGYGATCDAYHRVRPDPDMLQCARAMTMAIDGAGLEREQIDIVHYHGTSTQLNDAAETRAVKAALGESHALATTGHSVKSMIGHPQGASGAAALVATLAGLANLDGSESGPFAIPTINLDEPDIEGGCDLDYTPIHARPVGAGSTLHTLVNCLAFGAKNSALVLSCETGAPSYHHPS